MAAIKSAVAPFGAITTYGLVLRAEQAVAFVLNIGAALRRAAALQATRRQLSELSPEMRRDIGLSDDIEAEIMRLARRHRP